MTVIERIIRKKMNISNLSNFLLIKNIINKNKKICIKADMITIIKQ